MRDHICKFSADMQEAIDVPNQLPISGLGNRCGSCPKLPPLKVASCAVGCA